MNLASAEIPPLESGNYPSNQPGTFDSYNLDASMSPEGRKEFGV